MRDREALARELSNALREKLHWTYDDRALLSLVLIELARTTPAQPASQPAVGWTHDPKAPWRCLICGSERSACICFPRERVTPAVGGEREALKAIREIAHKHCTCTCRGDPAVLQNHTNLCDSISDAILEYAVSSAAPEQPAALPLAVHLRDEAGPPLPQMIAQRRAQLSQEQPAGYWKLPSMMSCRCEKLIRDTNGDRWCCTPYQEDS